MRKILFIFSFFFLMVSYVYAPSSYFEVFALKSVSINDDLIKESILKEDLTEIPQGKVISLYNSSNEIDLKEEELVHSVSNNIPIKYERDDLKITLPIEFEEKARYILSELPQNHTTPLKKIIAEYGKNKRRGLASFRSMYLGVDVINTDNEFRRVFIHEIGHVVDLGGLVSVKKEVDSGFRDGFNIIYESDLSLDFYRLCFIDEHTYNGNCKDKDYVSGYAKTDAFEDFAESYLLFVENNDSFLAMTKESDIIAKKYKFFAEKVFVGNFKKTGSLSLTENERIWDLTIIQ